MRNLSLFVLGGLATFNLACETVESEDVMSSGVYANIAITADGSGKSEVTTRLKVGGELSNTLLDLTGDDKLEASSGEETQAMTKRPGLFNDIRYTAEFDGDEEDKPFKVAFLRSIDAGAPSSTATMPASFELTAPAADTAFARATDDVEVTWDNAGKADTMRVTVSGECIKHFSEDLEGDSGSYTLAAGSLEDVNDEDPDSCEVHLRLSRVRAGTLDDGYGEGGHITAEVFREVTLETTP